MLQEFKEFAMRGSVVDLAVGVIIGGAFGKIVNSLVTDVLMPPIGILLGGVDFKDLAIELKAATETTQAVAINYGLFLNSVIQFLIVAFSIFIMIKALNTVTRKEIASTKAPK
jgi:large conductance mechanosensitive channel